MKTRFDKLLETKDFGEFYYAEIIDEQGYFYEICAELNGELIDIAVANDGVCLVFATKDCHIHTNIIPEVIFGKLESLKSKHLEKIINIIVATDGEGVMYKTTDVFKEWKNSE